MMHYNTGIPTAVIIGVLVLVGSIVLLLFWAKSSYSLFIRQASLCMLVGFFILVLCATVFFREETFEKRYELYPFWSYTILYNRLLAQLIMNVMMFIPIGFFSGGALKKKNLWNVLGIGYVLSLFIELTQLITTRGVFSVDDVIHNTFGCIIGYAFFVLCYKMAIKLRSVINFSESKVCVQKDEAMQ